MFRISSRTASSIEVPLPFQCLDHIIERDFFPDLKKLRRDTGCLPAESERVGMWFSKHYLLLIAKTCFYVLEFSTAQNPLLWLTGLGVTSRVSICVCQRQKILFGAQLT